MKDIILEKLKEIEREHCVEILFAIESGSRGWGFSSLDSDYDVRFVYKHKPSWYMSLDERRDVIELPVNRVLDINGWDLKKALNLGYRSNSVLWEWLMSPVVYREKNNFRNEMMMVLKECFSPVKAAHSYVSLAKRTMDAHYLGKERILMKKYFYIIRPLLAAFWITEGRGIPPMFFNDTLTLFSEDGEFLTALDELMKRKALSEEGELCDRIPAIDRVIDSVLPAVEETLASLSKGKGNLESLNEFFLRCVYD